MIKPTLANVLTLAILLLVPTRLRVQFCVDAPLPRLEIGMRGEVAPGIDRLRLRALPAVGTGEVQLLYGGNPFEVLAGPSCNGGFRWWRVVLDDGSTGWVAEGTWEEYYLRPVSNTPLPLCKRAETPWLHLIVTTVCTLLSTQW